MSQTWNVGNATITSIVEDETPGVPVQLFFAEATPDDIRSTTWLTPDIAAADGTIAFRVQAFLVRLPELTVLVDPCVGNGKTRDLPMWNQLDRPWLERLAAAGCAPTDIDMVIHTHLHEDHVGWDTHFDTESDGRWVPTFTNARHIYVDDELDHRREQTNPRYDVYEDSIEPVFAAGLGDIVAAGADLGRGLQLISTPGHTPGHVALHIATGGEPFVVTGDLLHHQAQLSHPHWAEIADHDADMARTTRGDFFSHHAKHGTLLGGTHFASQPVGRIETHGSAWRFDPVRADEK
jgi:glyoxylase-like metal-dependent hydrolase (beta-lactamase superfamily II)